jgi:hypothetical protein
MTAQERVYGYPTKNKEGFIKSEIEDLLKNYPDIDIEKFDDAFMGITCMMIDNELVIYHCDILTALRCGIEKRKMRSWEMD